MTAADLINDLESLGVELWEDDGSLRFRAPRGVLTEERKAALREQRDDVLAALRADADTGLVADPEHRYDPFPLTDVQTAYLLGRRDAFDFGGVGSHVYGELSFGPELDPERLRRAWASLVERHDMLRATVHPDGYQQVAATVPDVVVDVADLRGLPASEVSDALETTRTAMIDVIHDPQTWPLFDLRVTRLDEEARVHLCLDFLIADYLSVQALIEELAIAYHDPADLPPAPAIAFRDYVLAERDRRRGHRYVRDRTWWSERLDDLPPAPDLPRVSRPDAAASFRRLGSGLGRERWEAFTAAAAAHGVTPSVAVLSAYAAVLARWSRRGDFCLNLTLLNRQDVHPDVDRLVGDFTTVDLLAVDTAAAPTFAGVAADVQRRLWEDLDHRSYSGVEVMRELARRRDRAQALMPVVFTSTIGLGEGDDRRPGGGDRGRLVVGASRTPQVWIDCQAVEREGRLDLYWDVRDGVLPDGVLDAMFEAYTTLVTRLAEDPDAWGEGAVDTVALPAGQQERHAAANDTAADVAPRLLHTPLVRTARRTPAAPAVITADTVLDHGTLLARAAGVASYLRDGGLAPGELVAVALEKSPDQVVAVLGVLLAGGAYLPVEIDQPALRRASILDDAGVRFVLGDPEEGDDRRYRHPADIPAGDPDALPATSATPGDTAYVIYTSGSTGRPKGVVIAHSSAAGTVDDINARLSVGPQDRVLGIAGLGFDLSVWDLFGPLAAGGAVVLPDASRRTEPTHWLELVAELGVTLWNSVPAQAQMLRDALAAGAGPAPTTLRHMLLSGDWIPVALPDALRERLPGLSITSLGGATEGAIWSIAYPIEEVDPTWTSIPYGLPLTNQTIHVLDAEGRPCPDHVTGEIVIGGRGVAQGYLGDPERTAERFVTGPDGERRYRTGDLGRRRPDGVVEFLGREDSQVKIRGHRVELAEIDTALESHPQIAAATTLVDDEGPERRLVAFLAPVRHGHDAVAAEVDAHAGRILAGARDAASRATSGLPDDPDGRRQAALLDALDHLGAVLLLHELTDSGALDLTEARSADRVAEAFGAAEGRRHLVRRWLDTLTVAGLAVRDTTGFRAARRPGPTDLEQAWAHAEEAVSAAGEIGELLEILRRGASALGPVVRGSVDPREILLGAGADGPDAVATAVGSRSRIGRHTNGLVAGAVAEVARSHAARAEPVRVFEVGAGDGALSASVLDELAAEAPDVAVEYTVTDISTWFLEAAARRLEGRAGVRLERHDIDRDPVEQGRTLHSVDVVIASNVLHDAVDAGRAMRDLARLLRPGGHLVVLESTVDHPWVQASLGLVEDELEHTDLRWGTDRMVLDREEWLGLLARSGAHPVSVTPDPGAHDAVERGLAATGQTVFVARFGTDLADPAGVSEHLARRVPGHMVPSTLQLVERLPVTGNGKVDRKALAALLPRREDAAGGATDEPADELEARLSALWAEVLRLPRVGRRQDFFSLGGDSLLISRLASRLQEEVPELTPVPFDTLLRQVLAQPTVADLAEFVRARGPADPADGPAGPSAQGAPALVPLGGDDVPDGGTPVLVHDACGTLGPWVGTSRLLAARGRVLGLAVTKVAHYLERDPALLLDAVADEYATLLEDEGPVRLVGAGTGAAVTLEVARRLAEAGRPAVDVVLVGADPAAVRVDDPVLVDLAFAQVKGVAPEALGLPPGAFDRDGELTAAAAAALSVTPGHLAEGAVRARAGGDLAAGLDALARRGREGRLALVADALGRDDVSAAGHVEAHASVFRHSLEALASHRADVYVGDLTVVRTDRPALPWCRTDPVDAWREVALGDVTEGDPRSGDGLIAVVAAGQGVPA